jgi:hypothetical protein
MQASSIWQILADAVLALHFAVVLFVLGGALALLLGCARRWHWVRAPLWRWAHLAAITVVVLQSWLGQHCPLTLLEVWLRQQARLGTPLYARSFIGHWLQQLLYYEAPAWVFLAVYSLFGLLVLALWWRCPPRPWRRRR